MSESKVIPPAFDVEMHPVQIAGLPAMSAARKWEMMSRMYHAAVAMKAAQLRERHPGWSAAALDRATRRALLHAGT